MKRLATNQVVDAATVEGFTVAQLSPRAAFDSSKNLPDEAGTALTATITAPVDGFLIINASIGLQNFISSTDVVQCIVDVDGTFVTGSSMIVEVGGSDDVREICVTGGAEIVEAGLHTINVEIASLTLGTFLDDGFLTVLFVPFGATGQTPHIEDTPVPTTLPPLPPAPPPPPLP